MSDGIGVMIRQIFGGDRESSEIFSAAVGKKIASLALTDNELCFAFEDGTALKLSDQGQTCCERRYMRTDDDLTYYVGAVLRGAEVRDAPTLSKEAKDENDDDYGDHEVQFLVVSTDKGEFTMSSHNEHNGYYGGFAIEARRLPEQEE